METLAGDKNGLVSLNQNITNQEKVSKNLNATEKTENDAVLVSREPNLVLSSPFCDQVKPGIRLTEEKLKNVIKNQQVLMESLKQENEKFSTRSKLENVEMSMKLIEHYREKLLVIKKDMNSLEETSKRIVRYATHLEHLKDNAQLKEDNRKKRELLAEKELLAKFEES